MIKILPIPDDGKPIITAVDENDLSKGFDIKSFEIHNVIKDKSGNLFVDGIRIRKYDDLK